MSGKAGKQCETIRGIILRESLQTGKLPVILENRVIKTYEHLLGGKQPVEVIIVRVEQGKLAEVAFALADKLMPRGFFAHFVARDYMAVVFPQCISIVLRGDYGSIERTQAIGRMFGIPYEQMKFGEMFEKDHPND